MSLMEEPFAEATATTHLEETELVHNSLRLAVENEELAVVAYLLKHHMEPTVFDIVMAIEQSSYPILQLLLSSGFDINTPIREDCPPPLADVLSSRSSFVLFSTWSSSALFDPELLRWLVRYGANPNARCRTGTTPLSVAAQSASKEMLELLFELGASAKYGQPLHYAVACDRPNEITVLLLEKGAPVNSGMYENDQFSYHQFKDFGLRTPLHEAARNGNSRLVQLHLEYGEDPDIQDTLGNLPDIKNI